MLGSLEEMDEDVQERKEEKYFRPEIVCVHSKATGDSCSRCPSGEDKPPEPCPEQPEAVQHAPYPENQVYLLPPGTDPSEAGSERDPLSLDEGEEAVKGREEAVNGREEAGKEREEAMTGREEDGNVPPKKTAADSDMNSKKRFMFHLEGLKEDSGECCGGDPRGDIVLFLQDNTRFTPEVDSSGLRFISTVLLS